MPWIGVLELPVASGFTMVQDHMLNNTKARLRRGWLRGGNLQTPDINIISTSGSRYKITLIY